jgi:hypothetical protein
MNEKYSEDYSEILKFKKFQITLERELDGEFHIDVDTNAENLFTSFKFSIEDIQDIINEIKNYYSDSDENYEPMSLYAVSMDANDDAPLLEIATDKTFSILYFDNDDEVLRFQSELIKACD